MSYSPSNPDPHPADPGVSERPLCEHTGQWVRFRDSWGRAYAVCEACFTTIGPAFTAARHPDGRPRHVDGHPRVEEMHREVRPS